MYRPYVRRPNFIMNKKLVMLISGIKIEYIIIMWLCKYAFWSEWFNNAHDLANKINWVDTRPGHNASANGLPYILISNSMVSCRKGPTRHAYAWRIRPFWQDTLAMCPTEYKHAFQCAHGANGLTRLQCHANLEFHGDTICFANRSLFRFLCFLGQSESLDLHCLPFAGRCFNKPPGTHLLKVRLYQG